MPQILLVQNSMTPNNTVAPIIFTETQGGMRSINGGSMLVDLGTSQRTMSATNVQVNGGGVLIGTANVSTLSVNDNGTFSPGTLDLPARRGSQGVASPEGNLRPGGGESTLPGPDRRRASRQSAGRRVGR